LIPSLLYDEADISFGESITVVAQDSVYTADNVALPVDLPAPNCVVFDPDRFLDITNRSLVMLCSPSVSVKKKW
jgi:hypothetical protein